MAKIRKTNKTVEVKTEKKKKVIEETTNVKTEEDRKSKGKYS